MGKSLSLENMLRLRLYVAGHSPNSVLAEANLKAICAAHFASGHELEVIDLLKYPERATVDKILVTPTLLKTGPGPGQRLIGNLSDHEKVFTTLSAG